jgi:hypothetical protein
MNWRPFVATLAIVIVAGGIAFAVRELTVDMSTRYAELVVPTFTSWDDMSAFIDERQERLEQFAGEHPNEPISVTVTSSRRLNADDMRALSAQFRLNIYDVKWKMSQPSFWGGEVGLNPMMHLDELQQRAHDEGRLPLGAGFISTFSAAASARDLERLAGDSRILLVIADAAIDSYEGIRPEDFDSVGYPDLFQTFEQLRPTDAPP